MLNTFPIGDPLSSVFWGHLMSALIGLPGLVRETDFSAASISCVVVLGVFQLGLGYILFTKGLENTPPVSASMTRSAASPAAWRGPMQSALSRPSVTARRK